jgi:hypothetical protein
MASLVSLEEHNRVKYLDQVKAIATFGVPIYYRNGIQCPKCGEELVDSQGPVTMFARVPQYAVKCISERCGFSGLRY